MADDLLSPTRSGYSSDVTVRMTSSQPRWYINPILIRLPPIASCLSFSHRRTTVDYHTLLPVTHYTMRSLHIPFTVFVALALIVSSYPLARKEALAARAIKGAHIPESGAGSPMDLTSEPSAPSSIKPVLSGGLVEEKREELPPPLPDLSAIQNTPVTFPHGTVPNSVTSPLHFGVNDKEKREELNHLVSGLSCEMQNSPASCLSVSQVPSGKLVEKLEGLPVNKVVKTSGQTQNNLGNGVSQFDTMGDGSAGGEVIDTIRASQKYAGNTIATDAGMNKPNSPLDQVKSGAKAIAQAVTNNPTGPTTNIDGVADSVSEPSLG